MKNLSVLCIALCVGASATAAFARGGMGGAHGMGSSHMSMTGMPSTGGALGTTAAAPGTNSLGTAVSSSGTERPMKGPLLGTDAAIDRQEAKVDKMVGSICRGC
jgi:pectate lyase